MVQITDANTAEPSIVPEVCVIAQCLMNVCSDVQIAALKMSISGILFRKATEVTIALVEWALIPESDFILLCSKHRWLQPKSHLESL